MVRRMAGRVAKELDAGRGRPEDVRKRIRALVEDGVTQYFSLQNMVRRRHRRASNVLTSFQRAIAPSWSSGILWSSPTQTRTAVGFCVAFR
jgi:hypothetical protein